MKACFMGLGYIGLPTAVIAAKEGGVDVVGVDINPSVVEQTNAGHLHRRTRYGNYASRGGERW